MSGLLKWALGVPEFTSKEKFQITGRGTVYIVPTPSETLVNNIVGMVVIIDGKRFRVTGMEGHAITGSLYKRCNINGHIAILVRPLDN